MNAQELANLIERMGHLANTLADLADTMSPGFEHHASEAAEVARYCWEVAAELRQ